jgi:hypothetical protein
VAQHPAKVMFRGECVGEFYADIFVEEKVIVELKAVKAIASEHQARIINYLNATEKGIQVFVFSFVCLSILRMHVNRATRLFLSCSVAAIASDKVSALLYNPHTQPITRLAS